MRIILFSLAFLSLTSLAFAQKTNDFVIMPSLIKEAKQQGNFKQADSLAKSYINNYLFKLKGCDLFNGDDLNLIGKFLYNERSKGFKLFLKEPEKVNQVLGNYAAQKYLVSYINKKYLPNESDYKKIETAKWEALEKIVARKFGMLGIEAVYGQRMLYHYVNEDWKSYGIWYLKYYKIGLKHTRIHVNNMSWLIFEHVNDPKILSFACEVMKYAIEELPYKDYESFDTYANLLYKVGKRDKAIEWEERALKLSNSNEEIVRTLEKMKNNEITWSLATVSNL